MEKVNILLKGIIVGVIDAHVAIITMYMSGSRLAGLLAGMLVALVALVAAIVAYTRKE